MNRQELIKKVEVWHIEKETNDLEKQLLYLVAEFGEFIGAYLKNDRAEMMDGLGDTFVVLINIARLSGKDITFDDIPDNNDDTLLFDVSILLRNIEYVMKLVEFGKPITGEVRWICDDLLYIAKHVNLDLWECLESAYNVISKRTGKTVDGVFIKDGE